VTPDTETFLEIAAIWLRWDTKESGMGSDNFIHRAGARERRQQARCESPGLWLRIGDGLFRAEVWSRGGALLEGYDGPLSAGALFSIHSIGRDGGDDLVAVDIRARIARVDESGRPAVQFLGIDRRAHQIFSDLLQDMPPERENPWKPATPRFPPPPRARMASVR
jgi:hypothetical protein